MTDEQISELVTAFAKQMRRINYAEIVAGGSKVVLRHDNLGWTLEPWHDNFPNDAVLTISYPPSTGDDEADIIFSANVICLRLQRYFRIAKANASRTKEDRKASAKKAAEARWAKYRAEKQKGEDGE